MLRLRRAAILEQRLGKLDEASEELRALVVEDPDDVAALRFLADLADRLGSRAEAAPLLRKVSELAASADERADYGLRACLMHVAAGNMPAAHDVASTRSLLLSPIARASSSCCVELRAPRGRSRRAVRSGSSSSPRRRARGPSAARRGSSSRPRAPPPPSGTIRSRSIAPAARKSSTQARSTPCSRRAGSSTRSAAPAPRARRRRSSTICSASRSA